MRQCDLKLKTYMENKGLWQNSNSSTPSSFMQIYGDPRKKKTTKQNQKGKKRFSIHFAFTGYGKNGDPNISQAYRR